MVANGDDRQDIYEQGTLPNDNSQISMVSRSRPAEEEDGSVISSKSKRAKKQTPVLAPSEKRIVKGKGKAVSTFHPNYQ